MKIETKPFSQKQLAELKGYIALSTQLTRAVLFLFILLGSNQMKLLSEYNTRLIEYDFNHHSEYLKVK